MSSRNIRLVAADLDGTLLDNDKRIAAGTLAAIEQLPEFGVRFVIASARPPRSVRHIYQQLRLDTLQINYNGALIWDEPRQMAFSHTPMSGELALDVIRFARQREPGVLVTCEILDRWHTDRLDTTFTTQTGLLFQPDVVAPVESFCCGPVTKLLLLGPPSVILTLEPLIMERFADRISMVRTDQELLQICEHSVNKAVALKRIAEHYGVALKEVLAIGDGENDLEMLEECGIGVAVANAAARLKTAATWIAPSDNSHGVLDALRRFVL